MAIIYTYPTKATLATSDLILISDSADGNKTKNATVTSIKDAIDVVDSAASGSGISITGQGSGPYTGAITIANTGVLSFSNAFGTYITGTTNTSATGNASIGTLDLSAIDGVDASNRFLSKDNVWSTVVGVVGPGTTNKIPKFATTTTLGDSIMAEQAAAGVFASSYIEISGTGGLSTQDLEINAALWDGSASKGTSGQLLSSTGAEISWIAPPAAGAQGQVQYNDNPNLAGSANMTFTDSGSTALFQVRNIVQVRGGGGNAGVLKLWSTDDVTRVELQGPPTGGANYSLAMPASVGTANQVLKLPSTPGATNQLVWGDATGGSVSITADNTSTDYVDVQVSPSTITGTGTVMADLNAVDGTSDTTTRFLSKDNTWDVPSYTAASAVTSYTNANNNYILTSSGTGVINGESSLLYNGSTLTLGTSKVFNASRSSVTSGVATAPIYVTNSTTGSGGPTNFASNIAGGNGSRHIEFYHQGTAVGSITSTTTNIVINGESSDQRKKKNIVDWTENVLDKFALIEPKKFNFTHQNDSDPLRKGFIAQQMVDKFPEAYNHDYSISDTEGYYSFNAMGMNVYLMKAVKELKAEIDSLKSRISTLEG